MAEKNELEDKLMSLSADERALIAQRLWDSLGEFASPDIEKAWLKEAQKRWRDIEEGRVECIPAEAVMKRARNRLKQC